jgi:pyroglutamyl-peptidase
MDDIVDDIVFPILISAFEPFGSSTVNGCLEAAKRLVARNDSLELITVPVVRWEAQQPILARFQRNPLPRLYLALGEAGPEPVVRLEKFARNRDNFRMPDNAGNTATDAKIQALGQDIYEAPFPVERIAQELTGQTPLPVIISHDAGGFLCNHLSYAIADHLALRSLVPLPGPPICPFCFIHVPAWRPENGEEALDAIVTTLEKILAIAPEHQEDLWII